MASSEAGKTPAKTDLKIHWIPDNAVNWGGQCTEVYTALYCIVLHCTVLYCTLNCKLHCASYRKQFYSSKFYSLLWLNKWIWKEEDRDAELQAPMHPVPRFSSWKEDEQLKHVGHLIFQYIINILWKILFGPKIRVLSKKSKIIELRHSIFFVY